jgi:hypothetical protein
MDNSTMDQQAILQVLATSRGKDALLAGAYQQQHVKAVGSGELLYLLHHLNRGSCRLHLGHLLGWCLKGWIVGFCY